MTVSLSAPPIEAPSRDHQAEVVKKAIAHLEKIARQALDEVRVPAAASTDPKLLKIATETLLREDYEVGEWKRLVINVDKSTKTRREACLRGGSVSATLSYYTYEWDQFQVTTVEETDGELWLWANTLKFYRSGDSTTPTDRWILSRRFQLTPILPQDVDK